MPENAFQRNARKQKKKIKLKVQILGKHNNHSKYGISVSVYRMGKNHIGCNIKNTDKWKVLY